jgi:hypothetical protein
MQRRGQRHLRHRAGDGFQEVKLADRGTALGPAELAHDMRARRHIARHEAERRLVRLHLDAADAVEEALEIDRAAEFAVGHDVEADILLQLDDVADAAVFERLKVGRLLAEMLELREIAALEGFARGAELGRADEAADRLGA